jgi:tRNA modification GTPase
MSKITDLSRTIFALATGVGSGSIAIVRISGPDAIRIVNEIFHGKDLSKVAANTIHYGRISDQNHDFDQVMVSVFHHPHSYTGEDYIEISCHANPYIVDDIMSVLLKHGAYAARAGEFTLRAFLNGKMDLSQAEAVADIIQAKSRFGIKNSLEQLNGRLASQILDIKNTLIDILGLIEIDLDFSEEDLDVISRKEIIKQLESLEKKLDYLGTSYNYAKLLRGGIHLTIIGEPNAGKSTLLNQLLGENRAITSHIPGTTRDTIHENIVINNVLFNVVDTAGLRKTRNALETEGIKRTKSQASQADIVLLVVDTSKPLIETSWKVIKETVQWIKAQVICIANKSDLGQNKAAVKKLVSLKKPLITLSATSGNGIKLLEEAIVKQVSEGFEKYGDQLIITSKRQQEAMVNTVEQLRETKQLLNNNGGYEFAAVGLRQALSILGEITGETVTDDILNRVFANFCIGK